MYSTLTLSSLTYTYTTEIRLYSVYSNTHNFIPSSSTSHALQYCSFIKPYNTKHVCSVHRQSLVRGMRVYTTFVANTLQSISNLKTTGSRHKWLPWKCRLAVHKKPCPELGGTWTARGRSCLENSHILEFSVPALNAKKTFPVPFTILKVISLHTHEDWCPNTTVVIVSFFHSKSINRTQSKINMFITI